MPNPGPTVKSILDQERDRYENKRAKAPKRQRPKGKIRNAGT